MKTIDCVVHVAGERDTFMNRLNEAINDMQSRGASVEIQYKWQGDMHAALLIGRRESDEAFRRGGRRDG